MCRCGFTCDRRVVWVVDEASHVELRFTQIDSNEPEKVFGLSLKFRPDKSFSGE